MKKYLIFMLLLLVSIGVRAMETLTLSFSAKDQTINDTWKFSRVNDDDLKKLKTGDFIVVTFNGASKANQYAVKSATDTYKDGTEDKYKPYLTRIIPDDNGDPKTVDYFDCEDGQDKFTVTVTSAMVADFQAGKGLRIEYNGLSNLGIQRDRAADDWTQYNPVEQNEKNSIEIMGIPQEIKDWYSGAYRLQGDYSKYIGYTLRVVCLETADDSYAYLKESGDGWPAIMSGSDKFSIAGWKYFEIKLNNKLVNIINNGLMIGGNHYFIAGIYLYGENYNGDSKDLDWTDGDVVDTYDAKAGPTVTSGTWNYYDIPAEFFEYKNNDNGQISDVKIANTKNNIIRVNYTNATDGAQLTAIDNYQVDTDGKYASYIRERVGEVYYKDHFECTSGTGPDFVNAPPKFNFAC